MYDFMRFESTKTCRACHLCKVQATGQAMDKCCSPERAQPVDRSSCMCVTYDSS